MTYASPMLTHHGSTVHYYTAEGVNSLGGKLFEDVTPGLIITYPWGNYELAQG